MPTHILRIDCPDEQGLVHKITAVPFNAGYNRNKLRYDCRRDALQPRTGVLETPHLNVITAPQLSVVN